MTPFQLRVLAVTRRIPAGRVATYGDIATMARGIAKHWSAMDDADAMVALTSVNEKVAVPLEKAIAAELGAEIHRVRRDLPIPVGTCEIGRAHV